MSNIVDISQEKKESKWIDRFGYLKKYQKEIILKHFSPIPDPDWKLRYDRNPIKGIFYFLSAYAKPISVIMFLIFLFFRVILF